jgi:hypothetical protein
MNGNAFRVMLEHENGHATGSGTAGKFDFWVVKNADYKPKELEEVEEAPKRAMMDLDGVFTASS